MDLGSEVRDPEKPYSGSRGPKGTGSRIRNTVRKYFVRIRTRGSVIQIYGSGIRRPISFFSYNLVCTIQYTPTVDNKKDCCLIKYASGRIRILPVPEHFCDHRHQVFKKLNLFSENSFESLINHKDTYPVPGPGDHLIVDQPDPDPQHWLRWKLFRMIAFLYTRYHISFSG
jgi:hypothetical protein